MTTNVIGNSKIADIRLAVSVSGLVVTVAPGDFRLIEGAASASVDYSLPEEYTYTAVPDADEDTTAVGYLAVRESDGVVVLVTDEASPSDPTLFNWNGSGYRILFSLFRIHIPAAAVALDEANLSVTHHHAHAPEE